MEISKTFYSKDREAWRRWLAENFTTRREIWLVFPTKASGEESISYNDAVEEALCFGWIDSTLKRLSDGRLAQRLSPRRTKSLVNQNPHKQPVLLLPPPYQ